MNYNELQQLKEFAEEDMEDLEVNIEGSEEFVTEQIQDVDDSYTVEEETFTAEHIFDAITFNNIDFIFASSKLITE